MAYTPQTWANGAGGGTPTSAARLNYMEAGIDSAHDIADAAQVDADLALVKLGRGVFNILDEGAVAADNDTSAVANAAALANANTAAQAVGGAVYFRGGASTVYRTSATFTIYPNVRYIADPGVRLKLANSSNVDLVKTDNFDTLNAGSTQAGPTRFKLENLILDGNGANQTSGYTLSTYGSNFALNNVQITGGKSGNWRSKWGTGGSNMEAHIANVKCYNHRGGINLDWQGPHDSVFSNLHVFMDTSITAASGIHGLKTSGNAGAEQFVNTHVWGNHDNGLWLERSIRAASLATEGARINLLLDTHDSVIAGVDIFGTNGTGAWTGTEVGLQVGVSAGTNRRGNHIVGRSWWWASGDKPTNFLADDGNVVRLECRKNSATALIFGTPNYANGSYRLTCTDASTSTVGRDVLTGTGAPSNAMGVNGQLYVREDGGAGTTLYHRRTGVWAAIV